MITECLEVERILENISFNSLRIKKKRPRKYLHLLQVKTARRQEVTWSSEKSMDFVADSVDLNPALLITI